MNDTTEKLREGDIYHWRYKPEVEERRRAHTDPYWCKSRIAVVKNGVLQDTYWGLSSDNCVLRPEEIVLEYQGNPSEMTAIPDYERVFYRPEDVVDMSHPNNSRAPVYVKPGKDRDPETMKEYFNYKIERAEGDIRSANWRIEELRKALATVEGGNTSGSFPIYS